MTMQLINRLDLMVAYSCNLACTGCISLSDFDRDGVAPIEDIQAWLAHWSQMITPGIVTLFGGEPLLHPRLNLVCDSIKQHWPTSTIRLITNGYLLDNYDSALWFNYEPFEMQISMHREDHKKIINDKIKKILLHRKDWRVSVSQDPADHKQITWTSREFSLYKSQFKDFVVPFRWQDNQIKPWMSNAQQAHTMCGAPNTPVLYKGKLYKCPAVANALDLADSWIDYTPVETEHGLKEFVQSIGRPEDICAQCPDRSQAVIINHMDKHNVTVKQKNIS